MRYDKQNHNSSKICELWKNKVLFYFLQFFSSARLCVVLSSSKIQGCVLCKSRKMLIFKKHTCEHVEIYRSADNTDKHECALIFSTRNCLDI